MYGLSPLLWRSGNQIVCAGHGCDNLTHGGLPLHDVCVHCTLRIYVQVEIHVHVSQSLHAACTNDPVPTSMASLLASQKMLTGRVPLRKFCHCRINILCRNVSDPTPPPDIKNYICKYHLSVFILPFRKILFGSKRQAL